MIKSIPIHFFRQRLRGKNQSYRWSHFTLRSTIISLLFMLEPVYSLTPQLTCTWTFEYECTEKCMKIEIQREKKIKQQCPSHPASKYGCSLAWSWRNILPWDFLPLREDAFALRSRSWIIPRHHSCGLHSKLINT